MIVTSIKNKLKKSWDIHSNSLNCKGISVVYETTNIRPLLLADAQLVLGHLFRSFFIMENIGQIVRSKKTGKSRYTPINNDILQSSQLTCEEKTILIYLLSLPEDWVVYKTVIWGKMNIGRNRFNTHWKGLVEKGYIVSVRVIDTTTNLVRGWNHIVYEEPVLTESRIDQPSDLPNIGLSEKQGIYKEDILQSNNTTKEREGKKEKLTPTEQECIDEFILKGRSISEGVAFFNYWESMNWTRKAGKIQKWKMAVVSWIEKSKTFNKEIETSPQIINRKVFSLKEYDERT